MLEFTHVIQMAHATDESCIYLVQLMQVVSNSQRVKCIHLVGALSLKGWKGLKQDGVTWYIFIEGDNLWTLIVPFVEVLSF